VVEKKHLDFAAVVVVDYASACGEGVFGGETGAWSYATICCGVDVSG